MAARIVEGLARDGYKVVVLEVDRKHPQSLAMRIDSSLIATTNTTWTSKKEQRRHGNRTDEVTYSLDFDGGTLSHAESASAIVKNHKLNAENANDKICVVLEEAYDFIPESTFGAQDFGQPNVSRIAQLVLKCRKHQIGFLVITQRTALYQCNTIIALQTFDETSRNFMSAYINNKYLESMSILPRFRAIVVGKGSTCDKPIIVDFERRLAQLVRGERS